MLNSLISSIPFEINAEILFYCAKDAYLLYFIRYTAQKTVLHHLTQAISIAIERRDLIALKNLYPLPAKYPHLADGSIALQNLFIVKHSIENLLSQNNTPSYEDIKLIEYLGRSSLTPHPLQYKALRYVLKFHYYTSAQSILNKNIMILGEELLSLTDYCRHAPQSLISSIVERYFSNTQKTIDALLSGYAQVLEGTRIIDLDNPQILQFDPIIHSLSIALTQSKSVYERTQTILNIIQCLSLFSSAMNISYAISAEDIQFSLFPNQTQLQLKELAMLGQWPENTPQLPNLSDTLIGLSLGLYHHLEEIGNPKEYLQHLDHMIYNQYPDLHVSGNNKEHITFHFTKTLILLLHPALLNSNTKISDRTMNKIINFIGIITTHINIYKDIVRNLYKFLPIALLQEYRFIDKLVYQIFEQQHYGLLKFSTKCYEKYRIQHTINASDFPDLFSKFTSSIQNFFSKKLSLEATHHMSHSQYHADSIYRFTWVSSFFTMITTYPDILDSVIQYCIAHYTETYGDWLDLLEYSAPKLSLITQRTLLNQLSTSAESFAEYYVALWLGDKKPKPIQLLVTDLRNYSEELQDTIMTEDDEEEFFVSLYDEVKIALFNYYIENFENKSKRKIWYEILLNLDASIYLDAIETLEINSEYHKLYKLLEDTEYGLAKLGLFTLDDNEMPNIELLSDLLGTGLIQKAHHDGIISHEDWKKIYCKYLNDFQKNISNVFLDETDFIMIYEHKVRVMKYFQKILAIAYTGPCTEERTMLVKAIMQYFENIHPNKTQMLALKLSCLSLCEASVISQAFIDAKQNITNIIDLLEITAIKLKKNSDRKINAAQSFMDICRALQNFWMDNIKKLDHKEQDSRLVSWIHSLKSLMEYAPCATQLIDNYLAQQTKKSELIFSDLSLTFIHSNSLSATPETRSRSHSLSHSQI
ncbi:MAG: hypothetical protein FJ161_00160 [Gammaproteobacteria bacterium]|nr:hypothetical protein [Gammaproteobacteria bacterium]